MSAFEPDAARHACFICDLPRRSAVERIKSELGIEEPASSCGLLECVLALHPSYLRCELATTHRLMHSDGPLPPEMRYFIALLGISSHRSRFLFDRTRARYVAVGGDPAWLGAVPRKLAKLVKLNSILAHRPWMLSQEHIQELLRGDDAWSISMFVHALVILSQYHAASCLALGVGCDTPGMSGTPVVMRAVSEDDQLRERLSKDIGELLRGVSSEQVFERAAGGEDGGSAAAAAAAAATAWQREQPLSWADVDLAYEDFDVKSSAYSVYRVHDYAWEDEGFALLERYCQGLAPLLDQQFSLIYALTYGTFSEDQDVDTKPYRLVNVFLCRSTKAFVKKVVCTPEKLTQADFDAFSLALRNEEKVHIVLLAIEARKQAGLLYSLRAVASFINS